MSTCQRRHSRQLSTLMRRPRSVNVIALCGAVILAMSPSYGSDASARAERQTAARVTDAEFVTQFLNDWLVHHDLNAARRYVSPRFYMSEPYRGPDQWPAALQRLPLSERALRLPFECDNPLPACNALSDCIESPGKVPGRFDMQSVRVGQKAIDETPELRSWNGQELVYVAFKLNGCNVATTVLLEKQATSNARVISMSYFTG